MKKTVFILSFLFAMLFLTSCLDDKGNSYTDATYVYIDKADDGTAFGKKISSRGVYGNLTIVSSRIKPENVGDIKAMTYSWDDSYGVANLTKNGQSFVADKVVTTGKIIDVDKTVLIPTQLPEMEKHNDILEITPPVYADNKDYIEDYWIFQYAYKAAKKQTGELKFYMRDIDSEKPNKIIIDVDLALNGASDDVKNQETKTNVVAVNMRPLRAKLEAIRSTGKKVIDIEFHYYMGGKPQKSTRTYKLTIGE